MVISMSGTLIDLNFSEQCQVLRHLKMEGNNALLNVNEKQKFIFCLFTLPWQGNRVMKVIFDVIMYVCHNMLGLTTSN